MTTRRRKRQPCRTVEIRQHRETLEESLETVVMIECSIESLCKYINWNFNERGIFTTPATPERVHIKPRGNDTRCGWDAELIVVEGFGLWGVANGYIPTHRELFGHALA